MKAKFFSIASLAAVVALFGWTASASAQHFHPHGGTRTVVTVGGGFYSPRPVYYQPAPVFVAPTPVYVVRPAPVFVSPAPFYGSPAFGPSFGSPVFAPGFGAPIVRPAPVFVGGFGPPPGLSFGYSSFGQRSAFGIGVNIR